MVEQVAAQAVASPRRQALAAALDAAVDLVGAARVAIVLPGRDGAPRTVARRGFSAEAAAALAAALGAAEARAAALDQGDLPAPVQAWAAAHAAGALLLLPLALADDEAGALALVFAGPVTEARRRAATRVAALLTPALAARAPTPAPAVADDTAASDRFAHALLDVLNATVSAGNPRRASEAAGRVLLSVMPGIDVVRVWLADEAGEAVERMASVGLPPDFVEEYDRLPLDQDVAATDVLRDGRIVVRDQDVETWPAWLQAFARRLGLVMVAHVPMHSGGRVTGVLTLAARQRRVFTADEEAFLLALAGQLAGQLDVVRGHARVADERRRLRSLIDTLPEGLMLTDREGNIVDYNQAASDLLQLAPEDRGFSQRMARRVPHYPDGRPIPHADLPVARVGRGETVRGLEIVQQQPDGSEAPFLISAGPLVDGEGSTVGVAMVFQDITALKEVDRLKDDFINLVSHELRTPTTTIRGGALTLLRRGDRLDAETRRQLLHDIADEAERLHQLVEDLLSLTRARLGMRAQPEPLRLHRLVNKVVLTLGARLSGAAVDLQVPPALPLVDADEVVVEQVLRNLLLNAAKYGPRAAVITVAAETQGDEVVVGVVDRGPGLPPGELERVFEPFFRSDAAVRDGISGAGLGLTVCRRLVALYGGRIWAENRPGGGAAFRFTLPVTPDTVE